MMAPVISVINLESAKPSIIKQSTLVNINLNDKGIFHRKSFVPQNMDVVYEEPEKTARNKTKENCKEVSSNLKSNSMVSSDSSSSYCQSIVLKKQYIKAEEYNSVEESSVQDQNLLQRPSEHFNIQVRRASKSFTNIPASVQEMISMLKKDSKKEPDPYKRNVKSTLSKFFSKNKSLRGSSNRSKSPYL